MTTYVTSNGAIKSDLTALKAIPSTDLPSVGFVILFVASENNWFEYNPTLTTGDVRPVDNPATGYWIRIGRERLYANRTYYVRTDGNDNNNGLTNTSGGAFLTIQRFFDVLATIDKNGFNVTCKIADGTYNLTSGIIVKDGLGAGDIIVEGNTTTPANVLLTSSQSAIYYFSKNDSSFLYLKGFKFNSTVSPASYTVGFISCQRGSVAISDLDFGSVSSGIHMVAGASGIIYLSGNYTITGDGFAHIATIAGGLVRDWFTVNPSGTPITVTLSGTRSFGAFAFARGAGSMIDIFYQRVVFSGSSTGQKYIAQANSVIATFGGGASYFPGSSSGTTDGYGIYIE